MWNRLVIHVIIWSLLVLTSAFGELIRHELPHPMEDPLNAQGIDMDRDGDMDIVGSGVAEIGWWENDGQQNFTYHLISMAPLTALDFWVCDIDQDGDNDVLHGGLDYYEVNFWLNDGNQIFELHTPLDAIPSLEYVEAADIDLDGDMDVVASSIMGTALFHWWEQIGPLEFEHDTLMINEDFLEPNDEIGGPGRWSMGDLDGDGDLDLVMPNLENSLFLFEFEDGEFIQHAHQALPFHTKAVDIGDTDGDGDMEIANTHTSLPWPQYVEVDDDWQITPVFFDNDPPPLTHQIEVVDFTGNGLNDILIWVGDTDDAVLFYYEQIEPNNYLEQDHELTSGAITLDYVDVDEDGDADVILPEKAGAYQTFAWFENDVITGEYVSLSLVPASPPVILPPSGGTFSYSATISNTIAIPRSGQAWVTIVDPNGVEHTPFIRPIQVIPGQTINVASISQFVPWYAWSGNYIFTGKIGLFPGLVVEEDSFEFFKLAPSPDDPNQPDGRQWPSELIIAE